MRAPLFIASLALVACSTKPASTATDKDLLLFQVSMNMAKAPGNSDQDVADAVLDGMAQLDLGRTEACRDWLGTARVARTPAQRAQAVKTAADKCHFTCAPSGFESKTGAAIAKECGQDPLVPALSATERDALSGADYVFLRGLVEQTKLGLSRNPDDKARSLEQQLDQSLPRALKGAPR